MFAITVFIHRVELYSSISYLAFGQLQKKEKDQTHRKEYQGEADASCKIHIILILKLLFFLT